MKKSIRRFIVGLAILVGLIFNFNLNAVAAGDEDPSVGGGDGGVSAMPAVAISFNNDYATVPFPTVLLGRQAVTHYLLKQVKWVTIHFEGKSLASPEVQAKRQIYLPEIPGFTGTGSFSEISDIVAAGAMKLELIMSDKQLDLQVEIVLLDENWKKCFVGSMYIYEIKQNEGDSFVYIEPWLAMPYELNVDIGQPVSGAKWLPGDLKYVGARELNLSYDRNNTEGPTAVSFPSDLIGGGYLAIAEAKTGEVYVFDLLTGKEAHSKTFLAVFGRLRSSVVTTIRCPEGYTCTPMDLNLGLLFYRYDGEVWGTYPLVEYVSGSPVSAAVQIAIPIWGTRETVKPVSVTIIQLGTEKSVELKIDDDGKFLLELEPGMNHILVDFGDKINELGPKG